MSRGSEHVERAIKEAFLADPEGSYDVLWLAQIVYHDGDRSTPITENQRRSVARAAVKIAKQLGWEFYCSPVSTETADRVPGVRAGRLGRYQRPEVHRTVMRRAFRELRRLPADPTPEELAAEKARHQAAAAERVEHEAKVARVKAVLGEELSAELDRQRNTLAAAERTIEQTKIGIQAVLMRGRGLNNIAARVLQEAGGDIDKALEMIADRMIDEDAA